MLELSGLTRRYGDLVALDGVSFRVEPGQMFGFVGPNGAGKTTTMRIILGVLEPDAGTVEWRGRAVDAATRRRFGYMPEERGLYPKMKVRDQLAYFARLTGSTPRPRGPARCADRAARARRPGGRPRRDALARQPAARPARRRARARAGAPRPRRAVLGSRSSWRRRAQRRAPGASGGRRPVVFSSHQLELVERLCEAVAIVNGGRVVATGPVEELRERGRGADHVRVRIAGGNGAGWVDGVPGAELVEDTPRGTLIRLPAGGDPDRVLDAARSAGTVTHFSLERPTLTDLFRAAVAA